MKTRQVYFEDKLRVNLREADISPKPDEVLIKTHKSSICGTDKNFYLGWLPNKVRVEEYEADYEAGHEYPRPVGHEGAGYIVETGSAVSGFKVGDLVMSFGMFNTMADYFVAPLGPYGHAILKAPEGLSPDEASLGEPTACAIYAGMQSGVELGDNVLVVGAGFAGQVIAQTVRRMGAGKVFVSDIVPEKLTLAKKLSADRVIDPNKEDVVEVIKQETKGKGCDVVIEAAGNQFSIQTCTDSVKHGGILGLYSWVLQPVNLIIDRWHNDGLDIRTLAVMHRIKHDSVWYQRKALDNVRNGMIDIKSLMTHTFKLGDIQAAFDCVVNDVTACKVMLEP